MCRVHNYLFEGITISRFRCTHAKSMRLQNMSPTCRASNSSPSIACSLQSVPLKGTRLGDQWPKLRNDRYIDLRFAGVLDAVIASMFTRVAMDTTTPPPLSLPQSLISSFASCLALLPSRYTLIHECIPWCSPHTIHKKGRAPNMGEISIDLSDDMRSYSYMHHPRWKKMEGGPAGCGLSCLFELYSRCKQSGAETRSLLLWANTPR